VKKFFLLTALVGLMSGCASYQYASNVKLVGFDDNPQKGTSVGNIRGEDCTYTVLGYQMGGMPTVDRAFINAKNQAGSLESAGLSSSSSKAPGSAIRYINSVSTANDGFNAGLFAKNCIVVTGVGYK